jgi:hypothetical protein
VAAIIVFPIALAVALLAIVLLPILVLCSSLRDRIFGIKRPDERKAMKPPSYWPSSERTILSEHFGELHLARSGQAWLTATFPAFARFGSRYAESANWEDPPPDLPPPGEVPVMLGYPVMPGHEDVTARQTDSAEYRKLYDWLGCHQEAIAEEIQRQLPDPCSFFWRRDEEEAIPVADRFRISLVVLVCGIPTPGYEMLVQLWADQTWDPEHAWRAEISGIRDDGFFSLDFGMM